MLQLIFFKALYLFIICLDIFRFMTRLDVSKNSVGSISWGADTSAPTPTPDIRPVLSN